MFPDLCDTTLLLLALPSDTAAALDSNPVKITPIWREDTIPILPNWLLVFHGHERANSQSLLMRCCFYFLDHVQSF